jgi:hypothetical protein
MSSLNLHHHGVTRNVRFELPEQILMDRRPTLVKYAAHLRARGKSFVQIHEALLTVNEERCCPPFTDRRGLDDIRRIAKWVANKSAGVSEKGTISTPEKEAIEKALAFLDSFHWHGIASNNARIVASALLQKMHELGRVTEIGAACRDLAEVVGLSFPATAAALRRLCGIGKDKRDDIPVLFLRTKQKGCVEDREGLTVKSFSYEYSLNQSAISIHDTDGVRERLCVFKLHSLLSTVSHDAFRMRGYGLTRSAALVYAALPCATIGQIAMQTCLSRRTVFIALHSLHSEGLVTQDEARAWVRTDVTLDEVAKRRGTAGYGEKQRKMHRLQRESFTAWLVRPRGKKVGNPYALRKEEQEAPAPIWEEDIEWRDAA